ncbi:hypothetical protein M408DRAFT_334407 [Serendipita vermifera MAFF 305830]|uniref:Uncharacterized protein n=1 Tax=Serendipita vermifera MAFF 305830 TaxID=933852 RepID=A0A0C2VYL0_SERVB|nr:hypothetical protein M408DRAFT_334407 [Serendipita vermifera MAFF 305830]
MALPTNYNLNKYLAVIFERDSEYISHPSDLVASVPALEYVGQIGQLQDSHLYAIPLAVWDTFDMRQLESLRGITSVQIQEPKMRVKRGGDDL